MHRTARLAGLATVALAISGCGADVSDASSYEVRYGEVSIAGPGVTYVFVVTGDTIARTDIMYRRTPPSTTAPVTVTMTAKQRAAVDDLAQKTVDKGDVDARCTDSPGASLTVHYPDGKTQEVRVKYCGEQADSPIVALLAELSRIAPAKR